MATKTIGSGGDYTTVTQWSDYIKALGTLTENEIGILTDNAAYPCATSDLSFTSVSTAGQYTITLLATANKHDGSYGSGARLTTNVAYDGLRVYGDRDGALILEDLEISTLNANGAALQNSFRFTAKRCLFKDGNVVCLSSGPVHLEACRSNKTIRVDNVDSTLKHCTVIGATTGYDIRRQIDGIVKNNVAYNCTTDWGFNGGVGSCTNASNNASEDGTHPGTSGVTISGSPFEADGYTAAESGQLDGAGVDLDVTLDAANLGFSGIPAIGAYEAAAVNVTEVDDVYYGPPKDWMYVVFDGGVIPPDSILYYDDGTHTGADSASVLTDSSQSWTVDEWIGFKVRNITDQSEGTITDNDATTITATLAGGNANDWDTGDYYEIVMDIEENDQIVYQLDTTNNGTVINMTTKGVPTIFGVNSDHSFDVKIRDVSDSNNVSSTFTVTVDLDTPDLVYGYATETEENDTATSTGTVTGAGETTGAGSMTEQNDTISATGAVSGSGEVTGSLSITEAEDSLYGEGTDASVKYIGAGQDYTTVEAWGDYIRGLGTLTQDHIGILTDNTAYSCDTGSGNALTFNAVNTAGTYTITLKATVNKHDGSFDSGARLTSNGDYTGIQIRGDRDGAVILEDIEINSTHANGYAILNSFRFIARRCLIKSPNACVTTISTGPVHLEACRVVSTGGGKGIEVDNASSSLKNVSVFGASSGYDVNVTVTGDVKNCLAYNCTTDWDMGVYSLSSASNNASEDGTHSGANGVTITGGSPFNADGYTPADAGQLDGAGTDLSIDLDAANREFAATPSIGAYEK